MPIFAIMNTSELFKKALNFEFLTIEEGVHLYHHASTPDLMFVANELRKIKKNNNF